MLLTGGVTYRVVLNNDSCLSLTDEVWENMMHPKGAS